MSSSNDTQENGNGVSDIRKLWNDLREFSLRQHIAGARSAVNQQLAKLTNTPEIPTGVGENITEIVKKPLYEASEYAQRNLPWVSTVSRSHSPEIIAGYTISTYLFCLKYMRKWAVPSAVASGVYAAVATTIVNFKWYFPKESDKVK